MTQAFSDAGQRGDGSAIAPMLDDRVVFFNEGGDRATKAEMAASKDDPAQHGIATTMTIEDWHCEVHGNVAVASFIDDQRQDFHGQPFHARYRSVETWLNESGGWRMIASETIALQDDPAAVALPPALLDQYVGDYAAAADVRMSFARRGDDLVATIVGGGSSVQKVELKDVFYTPGHARTIKVFERDGEGKVIGFFLRREGHDIHFRRV